MVKIHGQSQRRSLGVIGLLVIGSASWGQTFGAAPIERPVADGATYITFISGHAAPTAGKVTSWELYAKATGQVVLQMWRPTTGGFNLIGQHDVTVDGLGLITYSPGSSGIDVEAGDVLGFRYNANTGIIAASFETSSWRWTSWPWPGGEVAVGGFMATERLVSPGPPREYSLQATVTPVPEPATMAALGLGALAMVRRRRNRSV
jgi:uncharacterized cupin superfamily protein